jgi:hypothetical protein
MNRALVCLGLTLLGVSMLAAYPRQATQRVDDPKPAVPAGTVAVDAEQRPLVFLFRSGSGQAAEMTGLVCAVWPDGVVLCARSWDQPGVNLAVGKLKGSVTDVTKQLEADGLATAPEVAVGVPDAGSFRIGFGPPISRTLRSWDERVFPNYGKNAMPDDAYRSFAAAWIKTKITLAGMVIEGRRDVAETDLKQGLFRGYSVARPETTGWLRPPEPAKKK